MAYDDDEKPRPRKEYPPSAAKLSKTPSWVMLGFVLGALFVLALPPRHPPVPAVPADVPGGEPAQPSRPRPPPQLTTIEAVFDQWKEFAVWSDDTTEVALWISEEKAYTDCYEVRRLGKDTYFFRTIPKLTRRIVMHGKPLPESPLQFTETEEQYQEWKQYGRSERPLERDYRPPPVTPRIRAVEPAISVSRSPLAPPPLEPLVAPLDQPAPGRTGKKN